LPSNQYFKNKSKDYVLGYLFGFEEGTTLAFEILFEANQQMHHHEHAHEEDGDSKEKPEYLK
jgi:hypothetical protein